jgi:hypothetical protein
MARSPLRHPRCRHVRVAALNVEAFLHECIGDPVLGLDFLKSELAEAEQTIDQLLREHAARFDVGDNFFLQRVKPRIGRCGRERAGSRRCWRRGAALGKDRWPQQCHYGNGEHQRVSSNTHHDPPEQ